MCFIPALGPSRRKLGTASAVDELTRSRHAPIRLPRGLLGCASGRFGNGRVRCYSHERTIYHAGKRQVNVLNCSKQLARACHLSPRSTTFCRVPGKPSTVIDTRVIYCGDNLDQLRKLPPACIDLIYIDPPFNSNRNYEVFWGETKEKRSFEDRHGS